jgi:CRISPR system Cascade subunit CasA
MFLTQLAAIALHRAGQSDPLISEDRWRQLLLGLTEGAHEPWSVVVADLSKPAFFQPPVPEGTIAGWKVSESPDDVDVLSTAKSHDVKAGLLRGDDIEAWVYALTTLQTTQGVYGSGKYGIARMKGGFATRPRVGCAADHALATRFLRDVDVLLSSWQALTHNFGYRDGGASLVWTGAWDGRTSLEAGDLTPHFIEACRRLRCFKIASRVACADTTTKVRRCLAASKDGDVGDPWVPVHRNNGALNVGKNGFRYDRLAELFSNDFEPSAAQAMRHGDGDPVMFLASALARGQGGTEGLHQRALLLTGPVRRKLGEPDGRAVLGRRAVTHVSLAATMRRKVLYPALMQLSRGGEPMPNDLDARVDDIFFDDLFRTLDMADHEASVAFSRRLADLAWSELQRSIDRTGAADARRLKAISDAERMFRACLKKNFPDAAAAVTASKAVPA